MEENTNGAEQGMDAETINAISELLSKPSPLIETLMSRATRETASSAEVIKRRQIGSYSIVMVIVISVSYLAWNGSIEGSGATAILGTIAGYIFCNANR